MRLNRGQEFVIGGYVPRSNVSDDQRRLYDRGAYWFCILSFVLTFALPLKARGSDISSDSVEHLDRRASQLAHVNPSQSIALYERELKIQQASHSASSPEVAGVREKLIAVELDAGDFSDAVVLIDKLVKDRDDSVLTGTPELADALLAHGDLYARAGRNDRAAELARRAEDIRRKVFGPDSLQVADAMTKSMLYEGPALGLPQPFDPAKPSSYEAAQRGAREKEESARHALSIIESAYGQEDPRIAINLLLLANVLSNSTSHQNESSKLVDHALRLLENHSPPPDPALGKLLTFVSSDSNQDQIRSRALALVSKIENERKDLAQVNDTSDERSMQAGSAEQQTALTVTVHSDLQDPPGKTAPALASTSTRVSTSNLVKARALRSHADSILKGNELLPLSQRKEPANQATELYEQSFELEQEALAPLDSELQENGRLLMGLLIYREEPEQRAKAASIGRVLLAPWLTATDVPLKIEDALPDDLTSLCRNLRNDHGNEYHMFHEKDQLLDLAVKCYEQEQRRGEQAIRTELGVVDDSVLRLSSWRVNSELIKFEQLLLDIAQGSTEDRSAIAAQNEAFAVAEQLRSGAATAAISKSELLRIHNNPQVVDAEQKLLDAQRRMHAANDAFRNGNWAVRIDSIEESETQAEAALFKAMPNFSSLANPRSLSPVQIADLLAPDEALIEFCSGSTPGHLAPESPGIGAWLIRPKVPAKFSFIRLRSEDLKGAISRLRSSVDLYPGREWQPYDVADAYSLYKNLLDPFTLEISHVKRLFVVPDDVMLPIPFAALLVDNEGKAFGSLDEEYRLRRYPSNAELHDVYPKLAWFIKRGVALALLPSASSLKTLRQEEVDHKKKKQGKAGTQFIGIGDPELTGKSNRSLRGLDAPMKPDVNMAEQIRNLSRLPWAHDELTTEARTLGADPAALLLDDKATKANVLALSGRRLAQAEIVSFATHAVILGEFDPLLGGLAAAPEPALVMTPESPISSADQELLKVDDIMGFDLSSSRLVILSGCNTNAAGRNEEGFAGLTRAFFFAGAPALLVSQWMVDDAATQQLMTGTLDAYTRRGKGADEALHDAMLSMVAAAEANKGKNYFSHPSAWAPFMVVGDGS